MKLRRFLVLTTAVSALGIASDDAWATPSRNYTCVSCHGSSASDGYNDSRLTLLNTSGSANPTERAGATDRGTLPTYQITAGSSKILSLQTNGAFSPNYGFVTNNYQKPGVVGGNTLTITPDAGWIAKSNAAGTFWYRKTYSSGTTYSFNMTVPAGSPADYYEFEMGWAGYGGNDSGLKRFYIQVLDGGPSHWNIANGGSWNTAGNWSGPVPNGVDVTAEFLGAITGDSTITIGAAYTVGTLNFNNVKCYTLAGTSTLTMDVTTGQAGINVMSGSHVISAPLVLNDDTTVTVTPANGTMSFTGAVAASGRNLAKAGSGAVVFENVRNALLVNAGKVRISPKPASNDSTGTSIVTALTLLAGAQLDLTNNALAIDYSASSPQSTIVPLLRTGYAGGAWTGNGITSSLAASNTRMAVAWAESSLLFGAAGGTFAGQSVDGSAFLLKYTYAGDSNFDGAVNTADFSMLAKNFNQSGKGWLDGDFNYDGAVNALDFNALASNFGSTLTSPGLGAVVPEPFIHMVLFLPLIFTRRMRAGRLPRPA